MGQTLTSFVSLDPSEPVKAKHGNPEEGNIHNSWTEDSSLSTNSSSSRSNLSTSTSDSSVISSRSWTEADLNPCQRKMSAERNSTAVTIVNESEA